MGIIVNNVKMCALAEYGECRESFLVTSRSPQQKCCCEKHSTRLRALRRRDRINKALSILNPPSRVSIPNLPGETPGTITLKKLIEVNKGEENG